MSSLALVRAGGRSLDGRLASVPAQALLAGLRAAGAVSEPEVAALGSPATSGWTRRLRALAVAKGEWTCRVLLSVLEGLEGPPRPGPFDFYDPQRDAVPGHRSDCPCCRPEPERAREDEEGEAKTGEEGPDDDEGEPKNGEEGPEDEEGGDEGPEDEEGEPTNEDEGPEDDDGGRDEGPNDDEGDEGPEDEEGEAKNEDEGPEDDDEGGDEGPDDEGGDEGPEDDDGDGGGDED